MVERMGIPAAATGAAAFLAHARWLSDYHRTRSRDVQARAVALLGFTGVLTGLLPVAVRAVVDLSGDPPAAVRPALIGAAAGLGAAALCALQAVRVRRGPSTSIADVRGLWGDALSAHLAHDPETAFAEWLLHGHADESGPLQGESDEADRRALWLFLGSLALTGAVLVALSLTVLLVVKGN